MVFAMRASSLSTTSITLFLQNFHDSHSLSSIFSLHSLFSPSFTSSESSDQSADSQQVSEQYSGGLCGFSENGGTMLHRIISPTCLVFSLTGKFSISIK